ncbi:DUF3265 domain-containing protein [Plesiomonas shigelloides]|nr:DUF3265 domain-containing protein [Plesiomonas shigelloides]
MLTNNLKAISNAWHFCYAFCLLFKAQCGSTSIALLTP